MEYDGHLKSFLATPKSQTTSSAPIINHCYSLKKVLETLTSFALVNNHYRGLRKGLETLTSFVPTNNHCCSLKEGLRTQLVSTTFIWFISGSDILENTLSNIELAKTGYTLWHRYCRRFRIKDLIPAACNLCKYIWKVILYIVLIDDGRLGLDIWPETLDQAKGIEEMMRTIWVGEAHCWQKASGTKTYLLSPFNKEARHISPLISCYMTIRLLN